MSPLSIFTFVTKRKKPAQFIYSSFGQQQVNFGSADLIRCGSSMLFSPLQPPLPSGKEMRWPHPSSSFAKKAVPSSVRSPPFPPLFPPLPRSSALFLPEVIKVPYDTAATRGGENEERGESRRNGNFAVEMSEPVQDSRFTHSHGITVGEIIGT